MAHVSHLSKSLRWILPRRRGACATSEPPRVLASDNHDLAPATVITGCLVHGPTLRVFWVSTKIDFNVFFFLTRFVKCLGLFVFIIL